MCERYLNSHKNLAKPNSIGLVDLNSNIELANCQLVIQGQFPSYQGGACNLLKKLTIIYDTAKFLAPDFLENSQTESNFKEHCQLANLILEFKSTQPMS